MRRRGFTLAELLATIVILGIITAITVPIVINQVDNYKKKMCVTQYDNILNAARAYASDHIQELSNSNTITLETLTKGGYIDGNNLKDVISEEKISPDLKIQIIKVGKKYKCYIVDNDAMGCGDEYKDLYDSSEPTAEIEVVSVGINDITVKGICTDPDSGISKYEFSLDNVNWVSNKNKPLKNTYTFKDLAPNTNYTLYVRCSNGMSAKTKGHTDKTTKELPTPTIIVPDGWAKEKTVTITADSGYKLEYIKNSENPVNVDKNTATVKFTEDGTIKARIRQGTHYGNYIEKTVDKIDETPPTTTEPTITKTTKTITITNHQTDSKSGIKKVEYGYKKSSEAESAWKWQDNNVITGLTAGGKYDIKTRATDNVGWTSTSEKVEVTLASLSEATFAINPGNNDWASSKNVTITYKETGGDVSEYYFKTTVNTTSNVAVAACGTSTTACSGSTTNIKANTWYKTTSKNPIISFTSNGTIIARTTDGTNYKDTSPFEVKKIDSQNPYATTNQVKVYVDAATIKIDAKDTESGIASVVCEYAKGEVTENYQNKVTGDITGCLIDGLQANQKYSYNVIITDNVGNQNKTQAVEGTFTTPDLNKPIFTTTGIGTISGSNYMTGETIKITYDSSNIYSQTTSTYYFRAESSATSSVAVASCGNSTTPETATCSGSTTNIAADTWYKTTSQVPQLTFTKENVKLVARIANRTDTKVDSTFTSKYITGTSINDYEKSSLIAHLDGLNNTNSSTWTNLANNTTAPVATTGGWQNGQKVCGAYDPNRGCLMWENLNGALYFDGVDDYLPFDFIKNKNNFTIEIVYKPIDLSNASSQYQVISSVEGAGVVIGGNGFGSANIGNSYHDDVTFTTPSTLNKVNYRALSIEYTFTVLDRDTYGNFITQSLTNFNLYSGENTTSTNKFVSVHSYPGQNYNDSEAPLVLGCNPADRNVSNVCRDGNFFKGYIYAVRIHDKALTDQQIAKNAFIDRKRYGF